MTINEASSRYNIPIKILKEYESWKLIKNTNKIPGAWQYNYNDIELVSMIMTLYDMGFNNTETERYMRLLMSERSTEKERLKMLNEKRNKTLDEIHFKEKQLEIMDYLRHKIRNLKE